MGICCGKPVIPDVVPKAEDPPEGLLKDIEDPREATAYSTTMSVPAAANLVMTQGVIYKAALLDAEQENERLDDYVKRIQGEVSPI